MENILENNKLIAEFLEYKVGNGTEKDPIVYIGVPNWYGQTSTKALGWLFFEKDWNMLMQAVEKIELMFDSKYDCSTFYDNRDEFKGWVTTWFCIDVKESILVDLDKLRFETKIESVYNAVVEFVKWNNKNK